MVHEGEAMGTPRRSPRRRKDLPETEKRSDMLKENLGGRGDEEVEDEARNSSSDEDMEKQRKIDDEIKRKWREKSIIPEPVARDRSRATEDGKKKFKLEVLLAAVGVILIASIYKSCIVDETWMSRSLPNDSFVLISWEDAEKELRSSVKDMKSRYPSQSMHTWIQILSAVSSTLEKQTPRQPSSLVLLTPPNLDSGFTPCLAREVGKVTHSLFRNVTGLQYTRRILQVGPGFLQDGKRTVTEIHDELKTYLNNGKVVIVSDLQQVNDPDRLMVFHAFCDNSAAPDTRATFIFIVPVPRRIYEKYDWASSSSAAEMTQEILDESWSSLTPDKRPALITRIAGYIAMVNPGDRCVE